MMEFITQNIYNEDFILFVEDYCYKNFVNFPFVQLDRNIGLKNWMFFQTVRLILSLAGAVLTSEIIKPNFFEVFSYDNFNMSVWFRFNESGITGGQYHIFEIITQNLQKQERNRKKIREYFENGFTPLLKMHQQIRYDTLNFFMNFIEFLAPQIEKLNDTKKHHQQVKMIEKYRGSLSIFHTNLKHPKQGSLDKNLKFLSNQTIDFLINYRNFLWTDIIIKRLHERRYALIHVGGAHVPGLKKALSEVVPLVPGQAKF